MGVGRVARDLGLHVVQHDAPHPGPRALEVDLRPLEHEPADLARLVDQDHAVGLAGHDGRVRHREHGRRVDEHDVVLVAHGGEELRHRRRRQELRGVGRDRPRLDDVEVVEPGRRQQVFHLEAAHEEVGHGADALLPAGVADQDVREAGLALDPEEAVDAGPAEVRADEQGLLPVLRQRERQVHDRGGLALLEGRAGDDEDLAGAVHPRELDVGPERPVGLGHRRLRVEVGDQERVALQRLAVHLGEVGPALEEAVDRLARVDVRDDAEHGDVEIALDVLDRPDRGVERLLDEREHEPQDQPDQGAGQDRTRPLAAGGGGGLGRRPHDRDFVDPLRLLDQRLLVLRLQEREQVVVDLRLALHALEGQLHRRQLSVLLEQVADLSVENLFTRPELGDLRGELAAQLGFDLPDLIVEHLDPRMPVGQLEGEVVALELQLHEARLQAGHRRVRRLDEHALRAAAPRLDAPEPALGELELRALLARLLDVPAKLREERQEDRGIRARRDHAVRLAEGPHLLLGMLDPRLHLAELLLDELPRLDDAGVAERGRVFLVDLGDRVREVSRLLRARRGRDDLDDVGAPDPARPDPVGERVERGRVRPRFPDGRLARPRRELAETLRDLLEHGIAPDDRRLRLDRVPARVRQHLDHEPREGRGLLVPDGRGRLVDRHLLPGEPEAEEGDEERGRDDHEPPAADDPPVVAEVHLVLRHVLDHLGVARHPTASGPGRTRGRRADNRRRRRGGPHAPARQPGDVPPTPAPSLGHGRGHPSPDPSPPALTTETPGGGGAPRAARSCSAPARRPPPRPPRAAPPPAVGGRA